ncbi:NB-ARC domain-containing protein [Kitasatospora purpeofusca]|uniref:NB-ARC domain-containing protein n=1 Tax=Kitasatospora purpeofusca TaxID=67352 RepID=UPI0033D9F1DF
MINLKSAAVATLLAAVATLLAVAVNAATADSTVDWPIGLNLVKTYGWWAVAALTVATIVLAAIQKRVGRPSAGDDDPPPPPAPMVEPWLVRRAELREAVDAVLARRARAVGLTTSLHGAGGFGKTRLARMVAADKKVRRHFDKRVYLVTLGRDVRSAAEIAAKVGEVTRLITGDEGTFTDPDLAGDHLGRLLEQRPRTLLVLDDVWEREQLAPFLRGAPRCVRLVTTRRGRLLEGRTDSRLVLVDGMTEQEARTVLLEDLDPAQIPAQAVEKLLARTGRWPLLLRLVNRLVIREVQLGVPVPDAMNTASRRLRDVGPAAADAAGMDAAVAAQREEAVEATIEAAVSLLPAGGPERLRELGIFAEDEAVPLALVRRLWHATASLSGDQANALLSELASLALVAVDPANGGRVSLHDVHRDYLRRSLGDAGLEAANLRLVEAVAANLPVAVPLAPGTPDPGHAWWDTADGYVLDHAIEHLHAAGRTHTAEALASDLRWIDRRLHQRGANAPIADLLRVGSSGATERARDITRAAHLFQRTQPGHSLTDVLHSRLTHLSRWNAQTAAHALQISHPRLSNLWTLPDLPQPGFLRTLMGPTDALSTMSEVVISPDGTWFATSGDDRCVRFWDRATGTEIAALSQIRDAHAVAISPDGSWFATGSDDRVVRIWDRATGTETAVLTGHTGEVDEVVISPDGAWLATCGNDRFVRIWDRATATETATLDHDRVRKVAISPDGAWLATCGDDRVVRIWDRATATETAVLSHASEVRGVAISPDGTWLATGSMDHTVRIWDRATATETAVLTGHTGSAGQVRISPDGTWLATGGRDHTVRIWDRATATETAVLTGHTDSVHAVAISPDGTWLATASADATVRLWDPVGARSGQASPTGRTGRVDAVATSPDGTWLATAGRDGTVRIWDRATATETAVLTGHTRPVNAVAISPDGTWLVTGGAEPVVQVWDRTTGTRTDVSTHHTYGVKAVAISPDGAWFATGGSTKVVSIWDRATTTEVAVLTGDADPVHAVAISPDGTWLAAGGGDHTVRIWDRATGAQTAGLTGNESGVNAVAISPDGTWLAAGGGDWDHSVRIWDRATGTPSAVLTGHTNPVTGVAISPDGAWLASVSRDATLRIWNATSRAPAAMMRTEHSLTSCSWSTDSQSIAVGSTGGVYYFRFHPGT